MEVLSPALMGFGLGGEAWTVKSTMGSAVCGGLEVTTMPLLLAVAWPVTVMVWAVVVMAGVASTSTDAEVHAVGVGHTASAGIKHVIVDPCTTPQFPVPVDTLAVGAGASPVIPAGKPAVKITCDALSGPVFPMLKVNAT